MGLLSFFKRRTEATSKAVPPAESGDAVQRARTRARQRLIGAVVLVGIGIIGFPLVFETQPRPIAVDIPIDVPKKEGAPALVMPAARSPAPSNSSASAVQAPASASALAVNPAPNEVTETQEDAAVVKPTTPVAEPSVPTKPSSKPASKPQAAEAPKPDPKVAKSRVETKTTAPTTTDSERAKSLLEGKSAPIAAAAGRFVLQVGAFADASAAHDTRVKVEKLGMKTFTQVVSTTTGSKIRVRVGPFANRDEAETALAKARAAGLSAVVLTL